jgi:ERCC4-type nuclease
MTVIKQWVSPFSIGLLIAGGLLVTMSAVVAVDNREPAILVDTVREHPDVDAVETHQLDAGDLVVGSVGIERKTLSDYANALIGRTDPDLFDQIRRLDQAYAHSYLLLEDQFPADGDERVPAPAIRGSAASITARLDTPVIPCSDRHRLVDMAVRLGRKHAEEPSVPPLPQGSVTAVDVPAVKQIYGCIDGIGPDTADRLYEHYPSIPKLMAAAPEELLAIEGIGSERRKAITSVFDSDA